MTAIVSSNSTSNLQTKRPKNDIDCEQCGLIKSKYSCPKCNFRSCSVNCVKLHKEVSKCDGQKLNFESVKKQSEYNDDISIKDKMFLTDVTEALVTGVKRAKNVPEPSVVKEKIRKVDVGKHTEITMNIVNKNDEKTNIEEGEINDEGKKNEINVDINEIIQNKEEDDEHGLIIDDEEEIVDEKDEQTMDNESNIKIDTSEELYNEKTEALQQNHQENVNSSTQKSEEKDSDDNEFIKKYTSTIENGFGQGLSRIEQKLISEVTRRRIFIKIENTSEAAGSSYEPISNTIFWTIDLNFLQEMPTKQSTQEAVEYSIDDKGVETEILDGYTVTKGNTIIEYKKEARSIPESIRVHTLLKQYLQPKLNGVVVSKNDLEEEKMNAFWNVGIDNIQVFMKVEEGDNERYYHIAKDKTILMNLRNRYIKGHPKFIIVLPHQFQHWQQLSEMEAQELHDLRAQKHKEERCQNNQDGNHRRGGRNGNRGRGYDNGGGFRGGRGGRGGRFGNGNNRNRGRRGGRGGFRGRDRRFQRNNDEIDLDYIFSGECDYQNDRPNYAPNYSDNAQSGWTNAISSRRYPGSYQE